MSPLVWIILIIIVLLVGIYIAIYNGLQKSRVFVDESWSQIDVQLKRRNDLIPNLVETTKRSSGRSRRSNEVVQSNY